MLFLITGFIVFISCSWLMVEYSLTIVSIIVVSIGICSFATSVEIISMTRLIQQSVVAELAFLPTLRGLVYGEYSFVRFANRKVKFISIFL